MGNDFPEINRRGLIAAGALGIAGMAAFAGMAGTAHATDYGNMTPKEKVNMKTVADFCAAYSDPNPDPNKVFSFMTEDGAWKQGQRPLMVGRAVLTARFAEMFKDIRHDLKIIDTFVRDDFLAHTRIDLRSVGGGPFVPGPGPIAGVFLMRGGKIAEWWELFFPRPA